MAYEVYCRECSWTAPDPVDLKGAANWLAGRHISDTGHSVAIKEVEEVGADGEDDFLRAVGRRVPVEILRPRSVEATVGSDAEPRRCGPVDCLVETVAPDG